MWNSRKSRSLPNNKSPLNNKGNMLLPTNTIKQCDVVDFVSPLPVGFRSALLEITTPDDVFETVVTLDLTTLRVGGLLRHTN